MGRIQKRGRSRRWTGRWPVVTNVFPRWIETSVGDEFFGEGSWKTDL